MIRIALRALAVGLLSAASVTAQTRPEAVAQTPPAPATLPLTLDEATRRALERNTTLAVERESMEQAELTILGARGAYDIFWTADAAWREWTDPVNSAFSGAPPGSLAPENEAVTASTDFTRLLPSGGTISVFSDWGRATTESVFTMLSPAYSTNLGFSLRQPILRGLRIDPAREAIRVASVERDASAARLARTVSDTVARVDTAYWSLVAARRDVASFESSVALADKQLSDTRARVEVGDLPQTDVAQPTAERERRRGDLARARQRVAEAENTVKALILRDPRDPAWAADIVPSDAPEPVSGSIELARALETGLSRREEIREARARQKRFEIQVEARANDVLPRLDLVGLYERRGLAGRRNPNSTGFTGEPIPVPDALEGNWGRSYGTIWDDEFPNTSVGLSFSFPIGNRTARANLAIARSQASQAAIGVSAIEQQVEAEVRNAVFALESARVRVEAARAARQAAETQLYAEQERFGAGLSTNFLVLTRQNDLTNALVTETSALTDYRRAATELARASGVLLEERSIQVDVPAESGAAAARRGNGGFE